MAHDYSKFTAEPIKIDVEHQGVEMEYWVKQISAAKFFDSLKGTNNSPTANMRRTFKALLVDEDGRELSKEEIEELVTNDAVFPLALKLQAKINTALGFDELNAKKG